MGCEENTAHGRQPENDESVCIDVTIFGKIIGQASGWDDGCGEAGTGLQFYDVTLNGIGEQLLGLQKETRVIGTLVLNPWAGTAQAFYANEDYETPHELSFCFAALG